MGPDDRAATIPWTLFAVLFASTSVVVGVMWDISWHQTIGRDAFLTPAHLAIYVGGLAAGLACGWLALKTTFAGTEEEKGRAVRFWGFRAPLGAWVAIWGTLAMLTSAPFDDWWHNAYGLDVQILSPPHVVLASGIIAIQIGALLMALAGQNQSPDAGEPGERKLSIAYLYAAGMLLAMVAVLISEYSFANDMHGSTFYRISLGVFPIVLFAVSRASRLAWAATTTALVYTGLVLAMMWILPLFPAEARLAPIQRAVTHMVPPEFPLLLVFPAIALDLLRRRFGGGGRVRDWTLASLGSIGFLAIFLAVSWTFSEFMLSESARNYFFQGDTWPYTSRPGAWQYQFWFENVDATGAFSASAFAKSAAWALPIGIISARVGLMWGNWMARVRR